MKTSLTAVSPRHRLAGAIMLLLLLGLALLALAADSMLATMAAAAPSGTGERFTVSGSHVAIWNLAGEVSIEASRGRAVEVTVTRGGRDGDRLDIETGTVRGKEALRVIYPSNRIVYPQIGRGSNSTMRVRGDGTWGDGGSDMPWSNSVRVSGSGTGLEAHADLRISVPVGQKIDVYLGVGQASVANVDGTLRVDVASADISSRDTRGSLVLDTGSGDIEVQGMEGELLCDTGSGRVGVSGVHGNKLSVDTGSGDVAGSDLDVATLLCDTGSGSIVLRNVSADHVSLDTGSGSVDVSLTRDLDDLAIDTGSGEVTVRVPRTFGAEVSIETGSGDIDTDVPFELSRRRDGELHGRIGDGRGRLVIETGSGSVRLASVEGRAR